MRKLTLLYILLFLVVSFTNAQLSDVVKEYQYKIIEKRVYPDTSVLTIKYFDKLGNEIAVYDPLVETTQLLCYQNNKLIRLIWLYKTDTTSIVRFQWQGKTLITIEQYTNQNRSLNFGKATYLDSSFRKWTNFEWYEIDQGDTTRIGVWNINYDSIGRETKRYIDSDSGKIYTCCRYECEKNQSITIQEDYKNDSIIYETRIVEDKKKRSTYRWDLKTGAKTNMAEYIDEDSFIYRKEVFGTIYRTCIVNNPKRNGQDKPITEMPDLVYVFEKIYSTK